MGGLDEIENRLSLGRVRPRFQGFDGLRCVQLRLQQKPKCRANLLNLLVSKTFPLEAYHVRTIRLSAAFAYSLRVRQHIFRDDGITAHITMRPDSTKLVHT